MRAEVATTPELACPIAPVVDIVFSRWTTPILWTLSEYGRQRFVDLPRRGPASFLTDRQHGLEHRRARTPAGDGRVRRVGAVGEVAAAVLWLASQEAAFVVGHDLVLDGGSTA